MLNSSFDRLMTLSEIEGPISVRPAVLTDGLEEVPTCDQDFFRSGAVPSGA